MECIEQIQKDMKTVYDKFYQACLSITKITEEIRQLKAEYQYVQCPEGKAWIEQRLRELGEVQSALFYDAKFHRSMWEDLQEELVEAGVVDDVEPEEVPWDSLH